MKQKSHRKCGTLDRVQATVEQLHPQLVLHLSATEEQNWQTEAVRLLRSGRRARPGGSPAAAFISIVIPLFVFIALQRFFVRGLLAGSVKG